MRNIILSAIVAAVASCRPSKKLAGIYTQHTWSPNAETHDTILVKQGKVGGKAGLIIDHRMHFKFEGDTQHYAHRDLDSCHFQRATRQANVDPANKDPATTYEFKPRERVVLFQCGIHRKIGR